MKRQLLFLLVVMLLFKAATAQLQQAGFFYDIDPGAGNGTPFTITSGNTVEMASQQFATNALSPGFHNLLIRFKDAQGRWSLPEIRPFFLGNIFLNNSNIDAAEYTFDNITAPGTHIPLAVTASVSLEQNFVIPTSGLAPGFHNLIIRTHQQNGNWSIAEVRPFFITEINVFNSAIDAAEYFFDTDPGFNNATPTPITPGTTVNITTPIPVTGLTAGFHNLVIRVHQQNGNWSLYEIRPIFIVQDDFITRNIVAGEYFIDTDPGIGAGVAMNIPAPVQTLELNVNIPLPNNLANGQHFLLARVKDNLNRWSVLELDTFTVSNALPVIGLKLNAVQHNGQNLLEFSTITEINSRLFEVEHSTNGVYFSTLHTVAAAGNSNTIKNYQFTHTNPSTGVNFYRIKQVDIDGTFAYSNIAKISNTVNVEALNIYPNPAFNYLTFKYNTTANKVIVNVFTPGGKPVLSTLMQSAGTYSIDISKLPSGMYVIEVTDGLHTQSTKFVKEH